MSANSLLVPVSGSSTERQTVKYAVRRVLDGTGEVRIRFVYVHPPDRTQETSPEEVVADAGLSPEQATRLLDRVAVWAREDAGEDISRLTVETAQIGLTEYLFSPEDLATRLVEETEEHDIPHILLDPEYNPGIGSPLLRPLEYELTRFRECTVEEAPAQLRTRRSPLVIRSTPVQVGSLFLVSFLFYQLLAGQLYWFDLVTGVISATIVAVGLSRVTFHRNPSLRSLSQIGRLILYIPYLLVQIVKSNILIAAVILHPRLPIEPRLTRVRTTVWGGIPVMTLANSITLTPGTLSVRVDGRSLTVHTLVPSAREDLFDGGLERAVRYVFYGRESMKIASPRERGDTKILQPIPGKSDGSDENESPGETGEADETEVSDDREASGDTEVSDDREASGDTETSDEQGGEKT